MGKGDAPKTPVSRLISIACRHREQQSQRAQNRREVDLSVRRARDDEREGRQESWMGGWLQWEGQKRKRKREIDGVLPGPSTCRHPSPPDTKNSRTLSTKHHYSQRRCTLSRHRFPNTPALLLLSTPASASPIYSHSAQEPPATLTAQQSQRALHCPHLHIHRALPLSTLPTS